jgi:hypothetical protein
VWFLDGTGNEQAISGFNVGQDGATLVTPDRDNPTGGHRRPYRGTRPGARQPCDQSDMPMWREESISSQV